MTLLIDLISIVVLALGLSVLETVWK